MDPFDKAEKDAKYAKGAGLSGGARDNCTQRINSLRVMMTPEERSRRIEECRKKTGGARVSGGANAWIQHVKQVQQQHGVSYKEAMQMAKKTYKGGAFLGTLSDEYGDNYPR